jgi:hypothetical protein
MRRVYNGSDLISFGGAFMASMPSNLASKPLGEATTQVVVLAFELLGQQTADLPNLLQKSLSDKTVQDAIQSALDTFMLNRMASGAGPSDLTAKDAQDLLNGIANSAGGKLGDAALNQIKNTPEYKKLEKAIADFQAAAKTAPMGVWLDNNSGIIFVTGIALAISGVAVLYATKTGGAVNDAIVGQIKGKPIQVLKVGKFTLQGQLLAFQPDKQTLGAGVIATEKWQGLQVSVSMGVIAAGTTVQQVNGAVVLKSGDVSLGFNATDALANKRINLGLTLGFDNGPLKPLKVGLGAVVTDGKMTGGTLNASLKTSAGEFGLRGQASDKQYSGLATWAVHF